MRDVTEYGRLVVLSVRALDGHTTRVSCRQTSNEKFGGIVISPALSSSLDVVQVAHFPKPGNSLSTLRPCVGFKNLSSGQARSLEDNRASSDSR